MKHTMSLIGFLAVLSVSQFGFLASSAKSFPMIAMAVSDNPECPPGQHWDPDMQMCMPD